MDLFAAAPKRTCEKAREKARDDCVVSAAVPVVGSRTQKRPAFFSTHPESSKVKKYFSYFQTTVFPIGMTSKGRHRQTCDRRSPGRRSSGTTPICGNNLLGHYVADPHVARHRLTVHDVTRKQEHPRRTDLTGDHQTQDRAMLDQQTDGPHFKADTFASDYAARVHRTGHCPTGGRVTTDHLAGDPCLL